MCLPYNECILLCNKLDLTWLDSKLNDPKFVSYIKSFSIICLTETFVQNIDTHDYENIFVVSHCLLLRVENYPIMVGALEERFV